MEYLLTHLYPREKGYTTDRQIAFPVRIFKEDFSLNDNKVCFECRSKDSMFADCNQRVLEISAHKEVHVLNFEQFINQFDGTPAAIIGDRCDYILYDEQKIAFCDVSCSSRKWVEPNNGKYPQGKRAKVYEQMKNSLNTLLTVTLLDTKILSFTFKDAIFGWRERDNYGEEDQAMLNMMLFSKTPSSQEKVLHTEVYAMGHNFSFVEVEYPQHYIWDENIY